MLYNRLQSNSALLRFTSTAEPNGRRVLIRHVFRPLLADAERRCAPVGSLISPR